MMPPLHLLTAGDARVAWGVAGLVGSVLTALPAGTTARLTVLDGGLPTWLRLRLEASARSRPELSLGFVPFVWPEARKAPPLEGSWMTYARLLATEQVADPFCLYLDADTVLRADPTPLFMQAAAAPDVPLWAGRNFPTGSYHTQLARQSAELVVGVPADAPYFNGGVQLINVAAWRKQGVAAQALALAARHRFIAHDQDALNVCFRGAWRELPGRWNFQLYGRHVWPEEAALLHYSGRNKPWHWGYPAAAAAPFRGALAAAGWPSWTPRPNLEQALRNSAWQPRLAQWKFRLRRWVGLPGLKER